MLYLVNPKVTKKQVDQAAADYAWARSEWGDANMETSRRLGKWLELQKAYEKQTGKPLYRINARRKGAGTMAKRRRKTKRTTKRRFSRKQLAAQRKFSRMAKARAKARRTPKRAARSAPVAKRKRKRARRSGTMASVRRHGGAVSRKTWRASGYTRNPRRRRRVGRRRYRRNPFGGGIMNRVIGLARDTGAVLVGGAAARTLTGFLPSFAPAGQTESPIIKFAKGTLVAIAINEIGRRVVSPDLARLAAAGALAVPLKDAVVSFVPQAANFLGGPDDVYFFPSAQQNGVGVYSEQPVTAVEDGMGVYSAIPGQDY